jgi:hypothetical protein
MTNPNTSPLRDEEGNILPALSAPVPDHYLMLDESQKKDVILNDDYCIIQHENKIDCFIRTYLIQKLLDSPEILEYGVWISISQENLIKYLEDGLEENQIISGYLCTQMYPYENVYQIKMNVIISNENERPESVPQDYQSQIKFVNDYYTGITKKEALDRVAMIHQNKN